MTRILNLLSEKVWHDLRTNDNTQRVRPHTMFQWIAIVLHLSLLIAFVLPCIAAQGHITNLQQIQFSTIAKHDPALLTKFLLIALQFISTVRVKPIGFIFVPIVTYVLNVFTELLYCTVGGHCAAAQ